MDAHPLTVTPAVSFADCLTYEFGVRLDHETEAVAAAQIGKARKLYNDLVAVMRETVDAIRTFENEKGGESAQLLQREIDELTELFRQAKALDDQDALKRIAQRRLEKWRLLGDMLKGVRIAHRAEIRERFLSKIGRKATCETYALRSMSVKDGLGWATANTVHESALLAFKKSFTLGKSPGFARGNEIDQDCLTLQFTDAGGSSAQAILEGRNAELALIPSNGCGRRKYGEFKFRLGSAKDGLYATGTWQYHRPIPDGSRITIARLVRRRLGLKYRWAASKGQCAVFELTGRTTSRCAICGGETHSDNESHQVLNCGDCGAELDRKRNGAVVAWQFVSQAFEAAVEDFWLTFVAQNAERKEKKAEKLEKLAESRRASVARAAT